MAKVKFGFKNAYYSKITENDGEITYDTPVKLDGAVNLTLSPSGDDVEFYADDSLYFGDSTNNGYEGSLELALIPKSFKKDILMEEEDSNGVLIEKANVVTNPFALLCEFTQDDGNRKFCFYHCTANRPNLEATTKGETKEVSTETLDIKVRPDVNGRVKVATDDQTAEEVINSWYDSVYTGTESY